MKKYSIFLIIIFLSFQKLTETTSYIFPKLFHFPEKQININNPLTNEGVELGRFLFYDKILSKDKSMSCASCHKQKHAFADNKKFSKGIYGESLKRNTLPIFNLAWYNKFFWDGRTSTIEEQVLFPVSDHVEMDLDWKTASKRINQSKFYRSKFKKAFGNQQIDSILICKAIAQFERTLISNNSKYDRGIQGKATFSDEELRGFVVVNDQSMGDCLHCHITDANALGTNGKFANNGLDKVFKSEDYVDKGKGAVSEIKNEIGQFKTPSLRNIALTAPYMHDGRFQTLEEVVDFYSEGVSSSINIDSKMQYAHKGGVHLSSEDKKAVIAFLKTLTDSVFISNSKFSDPFIKDL